MPRPAPEGTMVTGEMSMTTPINNFQDILDAMERDPALRDALRRHILTDELLQMPARLVRIKEDVSSLKEGQARLEEDVDSLKQGQARLEEGQARLEGDVKTLKEGQTQLTTEVREMRRELSTTGRRVSNITGRDYEAHVAEFIHRHLRRNLATNASVFATQRDRINLTELLDQAEIQGRIQHEHTDNLNRADLVLTVDDSTEYVLAEISITIRQDDIDRAAERAGLLARGNRPEGHTHRSRHETGTRPRNGRGQGDHHARTPRREQSHLNAANHHQPSTRLRTTRGHREGHTKRPPDGVQGVQKRCPIPQES